ncbi:ethanolamine permease [Sinomicrobium weinanense]|uniref:Ethanolamine permease n=1 Tax=Sinomicrobium weinanense TaxID=2842200 RepID=A0A926JU01_9FLAO|nr:ethanolamine permease [Sinomicrobium weinanense]MBC9797344.1 ethanolamine permease [Sinomicrobium weinanense]MBU3124524.1 ethanolamine permease [Sinomicrobium weinanense]
MSGVQLNKALNPLMLWGLGVGYVISGMYFGWNLGLAEGGTYGLAIATFFIIIMYCTFTFSYTEMACAIPKAGGAFEYANRGLGRHLGFVAGIAQNIEFVFAPPAIAAAIGAYLNLLYPSVDLMVFAIGAYLIFTGINILGVKLAASFELVITILAIIELLIFAGVALPEFKFENLQLNPMPNGFSGIFAAIPFAIWFFLAIEGVANVAEEAINPQRSVLIGFGSAIITLVVLCVLTFVSAVGVAGWEAIVYPEGSAVTSDSPLPLALSKIINESHILYKLLIGIGLLGLVASFHGIILAGGRATFEFGRVGYAPQVLGKVHSKFRTPANALIANMVVGIIALFTGKTGEIIAIACFGALCLYIVSMFSFFALRKKEPAMERPFKVPLFPLFPALALVIAVVALISMIYHYPVIAIVFLGIVSLSYLYFLLFLNKKMRYSTLWTQEK